MIDTTIVCIDTKNKIEALMAMDKSIKNMKFKSYKFFTDNLDNIKISMFENLFKVNLEIIYIPKIKNKFEYSKFCLVNLNDYISTDFCLIVQYDGYVINPECWTDKFFSFDYIGAPWPNTEFKNRVGNGGFSLRSKKFLEVCSNLFKDYPEIPIKYNHPDYLHEDFLACNAYYDEMIERGIKFADIKIASKFSVEHPFVEMENETFGFHGNFIQRGNKNEKYINITI